MNTMHTSTPTNNVPAATPTTRFQRSRCFHFKSLLPLWVACFAVANSEASTVVIDFDSLPGTSTGTLHPGSTFQSSGVTFTSGSIPNSITVGSVFTLSNADNQFRIYNFPSIVASVPNLGGASLTSGANDVLMSFATPVTSVTLTLDSTNEVADVVRLLGLESTGNANEFRVVALASALDNVTTAPANLLSVNLGSTPFSYALFQTTTEAEGFDNLTMTFVPEPSAALLSVIGVFTLLSRRNRHVKSA